MDRGVFGGVGGGGNWSTGSILLLPPPTDATDAQTDQSAARASLRAAVTARQGRITKHWAPGAQRTKAPHHHHPICPPKYQSTHSESYTSPQITERMSCFVLSPNGKLYNSESFSGLQGYICFTFCCFTSINSYYVTLSVFVVVFYIFISLFCTWATFQFSPQSTPPCMAGLDNQWGFLMLWSTSIIDPLSLFLFL